MMAEKARLFGDVYAHAESMRTTDPRRQKALGRKVRGFRENVWHAHRCAYRCAREHGQIHTE